MNCGMFTPIADDGSPYNRVHFFPKRGNRILIGGRVEVIPGGGNGVISGGVIGVVNNCSIEKVLGQTLASNTLYWVYVYMRDGAIMTMDFSLGRHVEDKCAGHQVHYDDPLRSLVGMVRTNPNGLIDGDGSQQCTLSWFNKEQSTLMAQLHGLYVDPTDANMSVPSGAPTLGFLTWAINGAFTESFPAPDVIVEGTVQNNTVGSYVHVGVQVDGNPAQHYIGGRKQTETGDCGFVRAKSVGANGAHEGYHTARPLIGNAGYGGRVTFASAIITVPGLYS